jgi:hypothetical protein
MSQINLFSKFSSMASQNDVMNLANELQKQGVISSREKLKLENEMFEAQMNIYSQKREMLQLDRKESNLLKNIYGVYKKINTRVDNIYLADKELGKQKKVLIVTEKRLLKLQNDKSGQSKKEAEILEKLIKKDKLSLEINKQKSKIAKDALSPMAKAYGTMRNLFKIDNMVVKGLLSGILSIGTGLVKLVLKPLKKIFNTFLQVQSISGKISADLGLSAEQANGLINNFSALGIEALKYGGALEDINTIMAKFSEITNKNRMFDKDDIGQLIELGLATGLGVDNAAEMAANFDNIGVSLNKTMKLTDKARKSAVFFNINSTKVLKTYDELVKSLTGIGYGKGLEYLEKLTSKAVALRFDIAQSTKSFTDAFFEPEKAVEVAAQMQVLGGKFATGFGDPISLAFESMTDPAGLADKFTSTLKGMVVKGKDGLFTIPPAQRKILKLAAETLGQNYEDSVNSAIEQAKIADKISAVAKQGFFGFDEDQKIALAGLMKLNKNNKYEIMMSDGTTKLLENITSKNQLNEIIKNRTVNEQAAIKRKNLVERLNLIVDRFSLAFSTVFSKLFENKNFDNLLGQIEKVGTDIAQFIANYINGNGGLTKTFEKVINKFKMVWEKIEKIWSGDGTFTAKIGKTLKDALLPLFVDAMKEAMQMLKYTFGEILSAIGLKTAGENLKIEASQNSKILNALNEGKYENAKVKENRSVGDAGAVVGKNIASAQFGGVRKFKNNWGELRNNATIMQTQSGSYIKNGKAYDKAGNLITNKRNAEMVQKYATKSVISKNIVGLGGMTFGKALAKRVPLLGTGFSVYSAVEDFKEGDITGGILNSLSALANLSNVVIPGIGSVISLGLDGINTARELGAFEDGVIYKDGSYAKFGKGDMVQMIDQKSYESNFGRDSFGKIVDNNASYYDNINNNNNGNIVHSGVIQIKSDDGKVVTWDQMYSARDLIGSRLSSIQDGYNKGFGNNQNSFNSPIKPILI